MLTTEEFHAWCQRLQLSKETEAIITNIRESPPVRKVRGRAGNVSGRYPSPKMQCSIQFEQGSVGWEEWKPASSLEELTADMPARYQRDEAGHWRCPPGETYAEQLGLTYRLRSSAEYHPLYIQNLKFLQDFWAHPPPIEAAQEAQVLALVETHPGVCLTEVLDACPSLSLDVVWAMLATRRLFTDLTAAFLMHHEQVKLYCHAAQADQGTIPPVVSSPPLVWDGRMFLVEAIGDLVTLRPEVGEPFTLPSAQLQHLMQEGAIRIVTAADPSPTTPEIRAAFLGASPKAQKAANWRLEQILAYVQGEEIASPRRSVQRWLRSFQAAEEQYGCLSTSSTERSASASTFLPQACGRFTEYENVLRLRKSPAHALDDERPTRSDPSSGIWIKRLYRHAS